MANEKGVWRTIGGRRVFIKEGQDLASAMKESGKFKSAKKIKIGDDRDKKLDDVIEKNKNKTQGELRKAISESNDETEKIGLKKLYDDMINEDKNIAKAMTEEKKANEPIEKRLEKQNRYTESESIKEVKDKYMPERTKAVSQYQNGEIDRNELMKRFDGNEQRMKETFEQMGYTAPTKENIDKANKRHEEFMNNLKNKEDSNKKEKPFDVRKYEVEVQHDNGKSKFNVTASDEETAKKMVMNAERAPESAIVGVKDKGSILNKEDSKKMTAPLGKEDDIGKTPYEKGEKYRNSIIETAKNSKEDNVTLDTETGKVATFDKGYSVSFQQSSDNYDDKEYYEKVEECRNKCDGKLYAGKYGGDAEASFHTDDIETAKELMYKYNQESIYDWEHETLIMNDKYDSSSNKTNYEAEKSTNDIMNEKIRSRGKAEDDLPKHVEIKSQGTSNRKEVSENIQAHILEHYDSPEDFIEQMDAYDWKPTMWHRGEALAEDGFYEIYYEDQRKFLDGLKINPKGKNFSDDRVFQTYKSLIGRESAKLYNRIQKNSYKKYMKAHPLSKMSFEEFKNMRGGK